MNRVIDDYFNQECNIDTSVKIGDCKRSFNLDSMNTPTTIPINCKLKGIDKHPILTWLKKIVGVFGRIWTRRGDT